MRKIGLALLIGIGSMINLQTRAAIVGGQIDNFQDSTKDNWTDGHAGADTVNITTGGPAGAGDHYLQLSSGSLDTDPRLIMFNRSQWTGNFVSAGVAQIEMDLKDLSSTALHIRIAIREGTGGSATPGYASTTAFDLTNDGQWHHAVFLLDTSSMTGINNPQPLTTDLANVQEFRILSSTAPALIGSTVSGRVGIDNVTAVVPEPVVMGPAILVAGLFSRRGRKGEQRNEDPDF